MSSGTSQYSAHFIAGNDKRLGLFKVCAPRRRPGQPDRPGSQVPSPQKPTLKSAMPSLGVLKVSAKTAEWSYEVVGLMVIG